MASEDGRAPDTLIEALFREPHRFSFFAAVTLLERHGRLGGSGGSGAGRKPVGGDARPRKEAVRFRALPSVAFPATQISALTEQQPDEGQEARPPEMTVAFLGLTGPSGVLPQHYTELQIRGRRDRNPALTDFLDLFNHRLVSLLMRAWEKYRLPAAYEQAGGTGADPVSESLFALIGLGTGHLRDRLKADDQALLHYAGHFAHWPRPAVALEAILSDYVARSVTIEQFQGHWARLAVEDRSHLPGPDAPEGQFCQLGHDVVIGDRVWDIQGSFRIRLGPLTYAEFREFMSEGAMLHRLADLTRLFVGPELSFDVQLILERQEVPECRLGAGDDFYEPRLGWNTWLKDGDYAADVSDAVFQAEDF